MSGTDESGRPVTAVIDLSLPASPPSPPETTSAAVRSIELAPRRAP